MSQYEIAKAAGITQTAVHYYINGDRLPSPKIAIRLENVTGICRESWMWPERHWNPYIPFTENSSLCGSCPNRIARIIRQNEICLDFFKKAENKREAFQGMVDIIVTHGGLCENHLILFREIFPDKLVLLGVGGDKRHGPAVQSGKRWQGLINQMQKKISISVPHWPHDIPSGIDPSYISLHREDPKSYYRFSSGRHLVLVVMGTDITMIFTPEILAELESFVCELDAIWHETYEF